MSIEHIEYNGFDISILTSFSDLADIEDSWKNILNINNSKNIYIDPNYFITQFESRSPQSTPFLIFISKANYVVGCIIAKIKKKVLPIKIGYVKSKTPLLNVMEIEIGGVLSNSNSDVEIVIIDYIKKLLDKKKIDTIEFQHLSEHNFIWNALKKNKINKRTIEIVGIEYLAEIRNAKTGEKIVFHKAKTIRNFRRSDRNLNEKLTNISVKQYDSIESIDEFISNSEIISKNSYHDKLGIGISKNDYWINLLTNLAKENFFKGFILYGNDKPIAYNYGVIHENYFYGFNMSFDLSFRKLMPGSYLIRRMTEELIKINIDYFHFGYGHSEYKKLFSNININESTFLVFNNSPKSFIAFWFLSISIKINENLINVLQKLGVLNKIKKIWRTIISR